MFPVSLARLCASGSRASAGSIAIHGTLGEKLRDYSGVEAATTRSNIISGLFRIRKDPSCFSKSTDLVESLRESIKQIGTEPQVLITCANVVSNQIKLSYALQNESNAGFICELLEEAITSPSELFGVFVARGLRAASILVPTRRSEKLISGFVNEAARPERVPHYTAMDLSELIHSACEIYKRCGSDTGSVYGERLRQILSTLLFSLAEEFAGRESSIKVRLHKSSRRETEVMTIQAVSNILYSVSEIEKVSERDFWGVLHRKCVVTAIHLVGRHTEDEAYRSCQVHHLMTLLDALGAFPNNTDLIWCRVVRKLLGELDRRFDQIDLSKNYKSRLLKLTSVVTDRRCLRLLSVIESRLGT